jgi:hypothetical protein
MTRAPRWLKPINKIYMVLLRRGVSFGAEQPLVLTVPRRMRGAGGPLAGVSHRPVHVASLVCPTARASGRRGG